MSMLADGPGGCCRMSRSCFRSRFLVDGQPCCTTCCRDCLLASTTRAASSLTSSRHLFVYQTLYIASDAAMNHVTLSSGDSHPAALKCVSLLECCVDVPRVDLTFVDVPSYLGWAVPFLSPAQLSPAQPSSVQPASPFAPFCEPFWNNTFAI